MNRFLYLCSSPCTAADANVIVSAASRAEMDPMMLFLLDEPIAIRPASSLFATVSSFFHSSSFVELPDILLVMLLLFYISEHIKHDIYCDFR